MRDLDMSDVLADADRMKSEMYEEMYIEFLDDTDAELEQARYNRGIDAREGCEDGITIVRMVDDILLGRIATTLCEGCRGQYGCDICCPPDFSGVNDAYNREAEEAMLGRPLFPNEY